MYTLRYTDKLKTSNNVMMKGIYDGEMTTNQEKVMEEISKENMEIKLKIDTFKRDHH